VSAPSPLDRGAIVCYNQARTTMSDRAAAERIALSPPAGWSYRYAWRFS
jgi:hypothetical protein